MIRSLVGLPEMAIMVHGMRNDSAGAASKVRIASERLASLCYGYPVIGFSYDSDVIGAGRGGNHTISLYVARAIAEKNGYNLAAFLEDYRQKSPTTSVRVLGHSLGSEVILSAVHELHKGGHANVVRSIHLFAASATRTHLDSARRVLDSVVTDVIKNYYYPNDEVLSVGHGFGLNLYPVGLYGMGFDDAKFQNISVSPENHRFTSYAAVLDSFP